MALDVTLAVAAGVDVTTELPLVCVTCALVVLNVLAAGPGVVLTVATPGEGVVLVVASCVVVCVGVVVGTVGTN